MTEEQSERREEVWVFGGSRVSDKKRWHAWALVGADGELYFAAKGSYVVGCEYRVSVSRTDGRTTLHGQPTFHQRHDDQDLRARLEAAHTAAETHLRLVALERNEGRSKALDDALAPWWSLRVRCPRRTATRSWRTYFRR